MEYKLDNLSVVEFAQFIRLRHGMFFRNSIKITDLENLINGYIINAKKDSLPPFHYFNRWVKEKLKKFGSTINWRTAIQEICNNDEEKAFWKFFELLDEFAVIKPLGIYVASLSKDNFSFYYCTNYEKPSRFVDTENKHIIYPAPYKIKIIEFDYATHSYYYDFNYVVLDSDLGRYNQCHESVQSCFELYKKEFGELVWDKIPYEQLMDEFKLITETCDISSKFHL
jgi:hypothetical protein